MRTNHVLWASHGTTQAHAFKPATFILRWQFQSCITLSVSQAVFFLFIFSEFLFSSSSFSANVSNSVSFIIQTVLTLTLNAHWIFNREHWPTHDCRSGRCANHKKNFSRSSTFLLHIFYYPFGVPAKPTFLYLVKQKWPDAEKTDQDYNPWRCRLFEDSCRDGSLLGNICGRFSFSRYSSLIALFLIQLCCDCKFTTLYKGREWESWLDEFLLGQTSLYLSLPLQTNDVDKAWWSVLLSNSVRILKYRLDGFKSGNKGSRKISTGFKIIDVYMIERCRHTLRGIPPCPTSTVNSHLDCPFSFQTVPHPKVIWVRTFSDLVSAFSTKDQYSCRLWLWSSDRKLWVHNLRSRWKESEVLVCI